MRLIFLAVAALLVFVSHAQTTQQDYYLNAHNAARAAVHSGASMTWNTTLEAFAKNAANQKKISTCSTAPFNGENIATGHPMTEAQAVSLWVSEQQYYSYPANTCAAGRNCDHYKQVVWRDSTTLGCARVTCTSGWDLIVCSYNPAGNVVGQLPY